MRLDANFVNDTSLLVEIVGLIITGASFWRITTVRKAQSEERELVRRLYGTDDLADRLRSAATFLRTDADVDARMLADELVRLVGQIEGITRVLESIQSAPRRSDSTLVLSNEEYFTPDSIRRDLRAARSTVDILIYRNMFVSGPGIIEAMESAAQRGVKIRILCLSSSSSDAVLELAVNVVPRPVPDAPDEYRQQLADAEQRIARVVTRDWSPAAQARFSYRGYTISPVWHFMRIDGVLKLGFLGTASAAQPGRYADRPYVQIPVTSSPGEILSRHFELLWNDTATKTLVPRAVADPQL